MSSFDTPQRQFVDYTKTENQYATMTPEISSLVDKLQEANFTPSKRIPLGLMFESNRGILASGAQRVLVKEREVVKTPKSANRGKTNFMKPTEAFRNGHVPLTTPSKSPKTIAAPMTATPTSKHAVSSGATSTLKKTSAVSPAVVPKSSQIPATPLAHHAVLQTPVRSTSASAQARSTSTPPSTKRPTPANPISAGSHARKTPEEAVSKRRFDSPKRAIPAAAPTTNAHNILFSPPRGNQRALDDTVLSGGGDVSLMLHSTPQRSQSNPRPARHSNASEVSHTEATLTRKPAVPVFDLRIKKHSNAAPSSAAAATTAVVPEEKRKAAIPHQQISPSFAARPSEVSLGVAPPTSGGSASTTAAAAPAVAAKSGPARFKNPPPSSVLVTTADMLSANKAAKKAVHASLFKPPVVHVSHYYTPPPPPPPPAVAAAFTSSAAPAPVGGANNGTPSRKAKVTTITTTATEAVAAVSDGPEEPSPPASTKQTTLSHKSGSTNSLFGPSSSAHQSSLTAPTVSSAKKAKKVKKVTISHHSPTILSSASVPLQPPAPPAVSHKFAKTYGQGDMDVDTVLNTLTATASSASAATAGGRGADVSDHNDDIDHSRLSSQSPHHALDYLSDVHKSVSFGSEISSLRGYPIDADLSMADTIDLSNNTSSIMMMMNEPNATSSPFESHLLASGTPISAITHASTGTNAAASAAMAAYRAARLELDENLLNVSAVEPAPSFSPNQQHSGGLVSFGSLSAFTPIPANQLVLNSTSGRSKPSRHHHNTATVTSRSTEYSNFYAQYSESGGYPYGGVPGLVRSTSSNNNSNSYSQAARRSFTASASMSPLTPHSTLAPPFAVSRQSSLNNTSILENDEESEVASAADGGESVASSNILNRGMMLMTPMSCSYSVASGFNPGDLMLNISDCASLASCSVAPVTPSNALNTAMMLSMSRSQSRIDGSPLKIELSSSMLSGTSSMPNTVASAHNVLNTGMFEGDDSVPASPDKQLAATTAASDAAEGRMKCFSGDSQSMLSDIPDLAVPVSAAVPAVTVNDESAGDVALMSRLDKLHLSDYVVRPEQYSGNASFVAEGPTSISNSCVVSRLLSRTITMNPQDIHCVELDDESELLDETEDSEVEPNFVVDMTSTAAASAAIIGGDSSSMPFEMSDDAKGSSGDAPNMTFSNTNESDQMGGMGGCSSMDDSMHQALDFVEGLVMPNSSNIREGSQIFLPQQVDSNGNSGSNEDDEDEAMPSFEFSEHQSASEDNDMVMLSDHDDDDDMGQEEEQLSAGYATAEEYDDLAGNEEDDDEDPPGPPPLEEADSLLLPPPRCSSFDHAEYNGDEQQHVTSFSGNGIEDSMYGPRRSACSPLPTLSGLTVPARSNVSESFEFRPRSLSMLPVPASIALTPVTKSYLDIERNLRNQHSASPRKVSSHLDFDAYQTMNEDLNSLSDVQVIAASEEQEDDEEEDFVSTLPLVPSQLPPSQVVYQQDSLDLSRTAHTHANTSLVSINTSGYNSSLCSNTSSVDELLKVNPRSKTSQWFLHHYHSSTAATANSAAAVAESSTMGVAMSSSASRSLRGAINEPMSIDEYDSSADQKLFHPREDISTITMCPDPVARQLSDEVAGASAAPSSDERDFRPVSGYFKLH